MKAGTWVLGLIAVALAGAFIAREHYARKPETGPAQTVALKPIEILLDWQAEPTYLGVYFANKKGYLADAGYSAKIIQSWGANQAVAAIASGKYKIGTASGGATVLGPNNGAKVVSLAVLYPKIPSVVYGLSAKGVSKPADLKGKRIGIYPGSITSNEFDAFLKVNGLKKEDVTIVSLSGADIPLLLADQVDAVLHYTEMSPVQVELNPQAPGNSGSKTFELKLSEYGVGGYGLNIIANPDAWKNEKEGMKKLSHAIVRGYKDGCAEREAAVSAFVGEFPDKDPNYVKQSWDRVCALVGANAGQQNAQGWNETIAIYRDLGLLTTNVTAAEIVGQ